MSGTSAWMIGFVASWATSRGKVDKTARSATRNAGVEYGMSSMSLKRRTPLRGRTWFPHRRGCSLVLSGGGGRRQSLPTSRSLTCTWPSEAHVVQSSRRCRQRHRRRTTSVRSPDSAASEKCHNIAEAARSSSALQLDVDDVPARIEGDFDAKRGSRVEFGRNADARVRDCHTVVPLLYGTQVLQVGR